MFESLIARGAARVPQEVAVRVGVGQALSYADMLQAIRRATAWLATRRIAKGGRVAIQVSDPYIFWVLAYACEALGLVFVGEMVVVPMTAERMTFLGVDHVLSGHPAPADTPVRWTQIGAAWRRTIAAFRATPLPERVRSPDDDICIVLSSGTTGLTKKVMLSRRMIDLRVTRAYAVFEEDDVRGQLVMFPVSSIGGILLSLLAWYTQNTIVFPQDGEPFDQLMAVGAVERLAAAPIHLEQMLASLPDDMARPAKLSVTTGGGLLSPSLSAEVQRRLTDDIRIAYGSTEAGALTVGTMADPHAPSECAGKLLPDVDVEIVDADGATMPRGELGEIRIRSVEVIAGYHEMPGETEAYFRDGWYYPGDLGRLHEDGTLVVEGRIDELLNFGGRKSLPGWIETAILRIDAVSDVAALSFNAGDTPRLGIAYVAPADVEPQHFVPILDGFIEPRVMRVSHIPRNPMGKIDRPGLRRVFEAGG